MNTAAGNSRHNGFTIVELAVVCVVLVIIGALSALGYSNIQKETRDQQREADIQLLRTALEQYYSKHGGYPGGGNTSYSDSVFPNDSITSSSTVQDVQQFLPNLPSEFRDPLYAGTDGKNIFVNSGIDTRYRNAYFYLGEWTYVKPNSGIGTGAQANFYNKNGAAQACNYGISLQTNVSASYIIGYYSETKKHFVFYRGEHGKQWSWPQNPETQPTCVPQN